MQEKFPPPQRKFILMDLPAEIFTTPQHETVARLLGFLLRELSAGLREYFLKSTKPAATFDLSLRRRCRASETDEVCRRRYAHYRSIKLLPTP